MKKALVRRDIRRLFEVQVESHPVCPPMEWVDCADGVRPETHDFDGTRFVSKPPPPASVPAKTVADLIVELTAAEKLKIKTALGL